MKKRFGWVLALALLPGALVLPARVHAQAAAAELSALAADALRHLKASDQAALNYTFLDTEHDVTHGGIFPSHHTTVSETIALMGMQYTKRTQYDGKPLQGKALEHEQALYDEAIRQRQTVSEVRAKQPGNFQHTVGDVQKRLLTDFDIRKVREEAVDGRPCTVLVFEPRAGVVPTPASRVTWWVDNASHEVVREDRLLLAMEDKVQPGGLFSRHYMAVDGVMLLHDSKQDMSWVEPAMKNMHIHLIATHAFTNYRKFRTSATILPASGEPEPGVP